MTGQLPDAEIPVQAADVADIASSVWDSFLGLTLESSDLQDFDVAAMTGVVGISGAWQGSIVVQCSTEHAVEAAEAMFAAEPGSLAESEVADALGELTNMIGGNIKSLLPEPSHLSIPSVSGGTNTKVFVPAARPALDVPLRCGDSFIRVTVWQA